MMQAGSVYIDLQLRQFESAMSLALSRLNRAQTIMDLVRAFHSRPHVAAYLKCLSPVRSSELRFQSMGERVAESLVNSRLDQLGLLVGEAEFCQARQSLLADVRHLIPIMPRLLRSVQRRLSAIDSSVANISLPDLSHTERGRP